MKQWFCDGWCRFKLWILYNYWRRIYSGEDCKDITKLYLKKRYEKRAMKAYIAYYDANPLQLETADMTGSDWYIGTINPEKMMTADQRVNDKEK